MKLIHLFTVLCLSFGIILLPACDLEDPDLGISAEQVISINASDATILADGLSITSLTATIEEAGEPNLSVTFSTNNGTFLETNGSNTYTITASGRTATATLVASTKSDENVVVTATVNGKDGNDNDLPFSATQALVFEPALPDNMILTTDKTSIPKNGSDQATLCVQLFRSQGMVSQEVQVNFSAVALDTAAVTLAPFAFSDAMAKATTEVKSANQKSGNVTITASVSQANGEVLEKTLDLVVVN